MRDPPDTDVDDDPPLTIRRSLGLAVVLLAIPPMIPVLAAFWPGLVPVPFVEDARVEDSSGLLAALGVALLAINAGFVYLFYRLLR